jgi:serine protease Do
MIETQHYSEPFFERRRARLSFVAIAAVVILALGLVAGAKAYHSGLASSFGAGPDASLASNAPLPAPASTASPESLSQAFAAVAKTIGPAVVHINIVQEVKRPTQQQFFGFGFGGQGEGGGTMKQKGSGSGVIVNGNGFILTNNHVVGKASSIEVKLADGRRMKGTVVGTDPQTDLAVVKIDATNLPTATIGDSDRLEQGDWVVAVGSPFGLEQTITAGIVSATGRHLPGSTYDAFIQTDASINPGNSGGPLVNLRGEVVGINTLIYSETGGNQGIGFSIPSSMARKIYEQLVSGNHKVVRGYFGVGVVDLDAALAQSLNVPDGTKGAAISDISGDNSPAAAAGLKAGDVVTAIDGRPVASAQDLTNLVADIAPGTSVKVDYLRDGRASSANVTVAERPSNAGVQPAEGEDDDDQGSNDSGASQEKLGVSARDVTPQIADELKLKIQSGAVIVSVDPSGAAAEAGLQRGDVVHRFGRSQVTSTADLAAAVKAAGAEGDVVLQVERGGRLAFVTVHLG